jgi:hypothetical protein
MPYCIETLKGRAQSIVSYHDFNGTPSADELRYLLVRMKDTGRGRLQTGDHGAQLRGQCQDITTGP